MLLYNSLKDLIIFVLLSLIQCMIPQQRHSLHLKQTEIALKKINEHEKMKQLQMMTMLSMPTQNSSFVYGNAIKLFEPKQKVKVQMLPNSLSYYRMLLSPQIDPKIIIRHFRVGMTELYICFDKLVKQLNKATYHFVLKDQMIVKFSPKHLENSKYIFLIFKNSSHLSFFVFRIDFVKKQKTTKQVRMDKSIGNVSIEFSQTEASVQRLKRSKSSKGKLNKITHITASEAILMKPQHKLKRILQLREQFEQKKEAATKRVQNIEIHKQKQMEAMKVVSTCKKMFNTYQQLVSEEEVKKQNIIQSSVPILYVIKYCLLSSIIFNERQKNMKRALTIRSFEKRFIRKIRRAYRQTKILQPNQPVRQLQPFTQLVCLIGNSLNRKDRKQSAKIMYDVFANCLPGFFINLSMNISSNYRRIVRVVQRRWKVRFGARMRMLLIYSQEQLQTILSSYPQLKYVQKQFRDSNKMHQICIQYQKETANKMKDLLSAYENKLEQIEEYKKINKQIREYNEGALKKKQKELLEIPKKPALPIFRFFRDLSFMKSMIRGELEILFRKFKKKNAQLFQKEADLSPKKDKKGK